MSKAKDSYNIRFYVSAIVLWSIVSLFLQTTVVTSLIEQILSLLGMTMSAKINLITTGFGTIILLFVGVVFSKELFKSKLNKMLNTVFRAVVHDLTNKKD